MPDFRWEPSSARYRAASGRFVPQTTVRVWVDQVVDASTERLVELTRRLQSGQMALSDWQGQMMAELKALHLSQAMAAHGGREQMAPADWGWTGQRLRQQYDYLRAWATEIEAGTAPLDGRLLARAKLYGQAGRSTFEEMRRRDMRGRGEDEERRVLHAAEHCAGCAGQAALGWQPLGTLAPIGSQECRANCRCAFSYRSASEAAA